MKSHIDYSLPPSPFSPTYIHIYEQKCTDTHAQARAHVQTHPHTINIRSNTKWSYYSMYIELLLVFCSFSVLYYYIPFRMWTFVEYILYDTIHGPVWWWNQMARHCIENHILVPLYWYFLRLLRPGLAHFWVIWRVFRSMVPLGGASMYSIGTKKAIGKIVTIKLLVKL